MSGGDHRQYLPLSEAVFFILVCLLPGPRHGYAIMKEVEALSESRVNLSTGTLYGALRRLLESGWVRRVGDGSGEQDGRQRKEYALTRLGRAILEAEAARLRRLVALTRERAGEGGRS